MRNIDINVDDRKTTTIRELAPGQWYVRTALFRRHGPKEMVKLVRRRMDDPFISETIFGSKVASFPSDKVHPCEVTESVGRG